MSSATLTARTTKADGTFDAKPALIALAELLKKTGDTLMSLALNTAATEQTPRLRLLTPKRAAEHFGVSRSTMFVWLNSGMPSVKRGRLRLIDPDEAHAWLHTDEPQKSEDWAAIAKEEANKATRRTRSRRT